MMIDSYLASDASPGRPRRVERDRWPTGIEQRIDPFGPARSDAARSGSATPRPALVSSSSALKSLAFGCCSLSLSTSICALVAISAGASGSVSLTMIDDQVSVRRCVANDGEARAAGRQWTPILGRVVELEAAGRILEGLVVDALVAEDAESLWASASAGGRQRHSSDSANASDRRAVRTMDADSWLQFLQLLSWLPVSSRAPGSISPRTCL